MTLRSTNSRRPAKGFTLIEVLAVVVIISVLMSAAAAPFVHSVNAYKGQYDLESRQIEVQRAIAEFTCYGRRAVYYDQPASQDGYVMRFSDAQGRRAVFLYSVTGVREDGKLVGTLSFTLPTVAYQYAGSYIAPAAGPFAVSQGGVSFSFEIESSGAPVQFQTFVHSSSL